MDPAEVAERVIDAVKSRRFYILTHGGAEAATQRRVDAIARGENPPALDPSVFAGD